MSIFHILRVFSWDMTFSQNWILHFHFEQYVSICCSWNFSIRCRECSCQSGISEFTCNRYGKCFGISVLTSYLEIPGSSPGVSKNFFLRPFTVPSPLTIKTRRIAKLFITLFSLDPLLFACNPYGRWLFLKSGFYTFMSFATIILCLNFVDFFS